jgi:hypothetical protein
MKRGILSIIFALVLALCASLVLALPAEAGVPTTWHVPTDRTTIQAAINAASSGDTIIVDAGTYPEALNLGGKGLTIDGAGVGATIVDAHSFTGYAVRNLGTSTTIQDLTLIGTGSSSSSYGFKVSNVSNITLQNIRVENSYKTAFDLNTVTNANLTDIEAVNTSAGFGVMMLDSNNIIVNNVATSGNAWGGVSIQTVGATSNNILFSGTFDVQEEISLLLEKDPPYYDITSVTIPSQFTHITYGFREAPYNYKQWLYQETLDDAKACAQALMTPGPFTYSDILIYDIAKANYYVIAGMKIQDAIDDASGTTINVAAGTYTEAVTINKSLTLRGATADVNKNGYTVPADYAWDDTVESIIMHPNPGSKYNAIVDIVDVSNVTFEGFVVQELNAVGNNDNSLVRVYAHTQQISNIVVRNNIIGPFTNTTAQDGAQGRMGLYLVNDPYSDQHGIVDSTFSGNKIFNCEGNGNNVFIWSSYLQYGATGPASMAGTVIEDNEICGAHRSGIETAGGFSDLAISNNSIYGNGGPGITGKPDLMFGNGIVMIRGSGDRENVNGYGPVDVTILNNEIYNNEGHGIYMGPNNDKIFITSNSLHNNDKNAIMVDLIGNYWNPDFETYTGPYTNLAGSQDINAQFNNIYGNADYGVQVIGTPTNGFVLYATNGWWGSANGPTHAGNTFNVGAQGETVSDYVNYVPWLDAASPAGAAFAPVTTTAPVGSFASIQAGIDAASPGSTVNVAVGTYDEPVTINKNNLTLDGEVGSMPAITGGLKFDTNLAGLTLQNFYVTGTVDTGNKDSLVRMYGTITDLTVDNCVFDGENFADRMGFSGGQIEGDLTVTNSEFKDIMGWAVLDTKSGSGGDGSAMGTVTFANNNIHECNGSVVFRGLSTDRTDAVNAYNNTWNNIGGNNAEQGKQWAALEVNRAISAEVYDNTVNNVALGEYGEGQAFQFWDIDTLKVHGNDITSNYQGIWIYSDGAFAVPGGYISFNNIVGNDQYGISVDPTVTGGVLNAKNNWWGAKDGPSDDGTGVKDTVTAKPAAGSGDKVSANVNFDPWIGASVTASTSETVTGNGTVNAKNEANTEVVVSGTGSPTVTVTQYSSNPGSGFGGDTGNYVDVHIDDITNVTEIEVRLYYTDAEIAGKIESTLAMRWWNGYAWVECSDCGVNTTDIAGPPAYSGYMWAKIRPAADPHPTIPTLGDLTGTPFGGGGSLTGGAGGGGGASSLPKVGSVSLLQYLDWQGKTRIDIKIRSDDGVVTLAVPRGTLMRDAEGKPLATLSVLALETPPPPPGYVLVGHAYNCMPAGANFAPNVTITFAYNKADIPDGVSEESLLLAYWDGNKWINLPTTASVAGNIATAKVEHFTPFALMAYTGLTHFSASGLSIQPQEAQPNEAVTISVSVANTGDAEGVYSVVLKINGVKETEKSVTLAAGASQNVSFSVTRGEAASYPVDVNGLTGSFTVAAPAPPAEETPPASTPAPAPIAWWIWVIAGVVVVAAGLTTFFTVRRRAY